MSPRHPPPGIARRPPGAQGPEPHPSVSSNFVVRSVHMAIVRRLLRVLHPWIVRAAVKGNLRVMPGPGAGALGTLRRLPMKVATGVEWTYFEVLASAVVCCPTYCLKTIS